MKQIVDELTITRNDVDDKHRNLKEMIKKTDTLVTSNSLKVREFTDIIDRIEGF